MDSASYDSPKPYNQEEKSIQFETKSQKISLPMSAILTMKENKTNPRTPINANLEKQMTTVLNQIWEHNTSNKNYQHKLKTTISYAKFYAPDSLGERKYVKVDQLRKWIDRKKPARKLLVLERHLTIRRFG